MDGAGAAVRPEVKRLYASRDLWAGFTLATFGVLAWTLGPAERGDATHMAAGYFPHLLGTLLVVAGCALVGFGIRSEPRQEAVPLRRGARQFFVLPAVIVFALLFERAGFVIASLTLLIVGALAARGLALREFVVVAFVLLALVLAIFVWALGMPVKVWPG
jgi:hypothetical protein